MNPLSQPKMCSFTTFLKSGDPPFQAFGDDGAQKCALAAVIAAATAAATVAAAAPTAPAATAAAPPPAFLEGAVAAAAVAVVAVPVAVAVPLGSAAAAARAVAAAAHAVDDPAPAAAAQAAAAADAAAAAAVAGCQTPVSKPGVPAQNTSTFIPGHEAAPLQAEIARLQYSDLIYSARPHHFMSKNLP